MKLFGLFFFPLIKYLQRSRSIRSWGPGRVTCGYLCWLTLFILLLENLSEPSSAEWRAVPVKSLQVFSQDQSENRSVWVHNRPQGPMEMSWGPVISYFHVSINAAWQKTNKLSHRTHVQLLLRDPAQVFSLSPHLHSRLRLWLKQVWRLIEGKWDWDFKIEGRAFTCGCYTVEYC